MTKSKAEFDKDYTKFAKAIAEAVAEEREACAKIAEGFDKFSIKATVLIDSAVARTIADAIRDRGNQG